MSGVLADSNAAVKGRQGNFAASTLDPTSCNKAPVQSVGAVEVGSVENETTEFQHHVLIVFCDLGL